MNQDQRIKKAIELANSAAEVPMQLFFIYSDVVFFITNTERNSAFRMHAETDLVELWAIHCSTWIYWDLFSFVQPRTEPSKLPRALLVVD